MSVVDLFRLIILYFRKHFSEAEIEILISKYDVDGNTMFTQSEIKAIQDAQEPLTEEPTDT